jgi:tol-pal system protein YbgF
MIRCWFIPQVVSALLLVLSAEIAMVAVAYAQDAATQDRLDRLERDLSMLQRQVYRGGVSAGDRGAAAGGNLAVDTQIRMDRIEEQMRDLTGRVEDETNQIQQLRQRLEQINSDIDVRFSQQGQGVAQGRSSGGTLPPAAAASAQRVRATYAARGANDTIGTPDENQTPPPVYDGATSPGRMSPGGYSPPADGSADGPGPGTLTPPGISPDPTGSMPQTASAAAGGGFRSGGVRALPSGSASAQYNSAFGLLRQADYPAAETALRNFVQQHPDNPLAGNAQYWLGESYYARGQYAEAASAFAEGYRRYPKGAKAADGLLKLAIALDHANQKRNACVALIQLDHAFPHPGNAVKDRATATKKRLGC